MQLFVHQKIANLRALVSLLTSASEDILTSWEEEGAVPDSPKTQQHHSTLPSHRLFDATRTAVTAAAQIISEVQDPQQRCLEICSQYMEARAFHVAVEKNVADLLKDADEQDGVSVEVLSIEMGRILRALCCIYIFREVQDGFFANSPTSACLVGNEGLRAYIVSMGWEQYEASVSLPTVLYDPARTHSNSSTNTAFQQQFKTTLSRWDWMEESVLQPDGKLGPRPNLKMFGMAMVGGGRVYGPPLCADYPWADLGTATVIDIGGGIGGMSLDLAKKFPDLRFKVPDRPHVLRLAKTLWDHELPDAVESGQVELICHDFFQEQPVKGAEIYLMRYIMHDWDDERCSNILNALLPAVTTPQSRILISDQVMITTAHPPLPSTFSTSVIRPAPAPLLPNYGYASRFKHMRDLNMLTLTNGRERTLGDWERLAKAAGMEIEKIWECRGAVWIMELRKRMRNEN